MRSTGRLATLSLVVAGALPTPRLEAQTTLERTPLGSAGWVSEPGNLQVNTSFRFSDRTDGIDGVGVVPGFEAAFGLPRWTLVGARFSPGSPVQARTSDEWEVFGRHRPLTQHRGAPFDLAFELGYNGAARSADAELMVSRWTGPLRVLAAGRVFTDAYGEGDFRGVIAAGALVFPAPGMLPLSLAADLALDPGHDADDVAWALGGQLGLPETFHTVSLFLTNTGSGSRQAASRGGFGTRLGLELTLPIPIGRFLGWYPEREVAQRAVVEPVDPLQVEVSRGTIFRYLFVQDRIHVPAGSTIEWTNLDDVVHTVTANDAAWNSGAITPRGSWRATFNEPGVYTYHCGPHPFMKGVVVVEP
jgi:plastocyanin